MATKEVQVFNISFLDLLSGALAAVIILFIIVPRLDASSKDALEALQELGVEVDSLEDKLAQLENSVDKKLYREIKASLDKMREALDAAEQDITRLEEQVVTLETQVKDLKKYKDWMDNCGYDPDSPCPPEAVSSKGFSFQGKRIVFLTDVSGSMTRDVDKLSPMKAGLRMLVATLDDEFYMDIVQFPFRGDCDFNPHFSSLMPMTESNRASLNGFLRSLRANGGTPIGETLEFVFQTYPDMTDIVILTDGEPGCKQGDNAGVLSRQIIADVERWNTTNVRISAIGLGPDFFDDPNAVRVLFLEELTRKNGNGFFIKFD